MISESKTQPSAAPGKAAAGLPPTRPGPHPDAALAWSDLNAPPLWAYSPADNRVHFLELLEAGSTARNGTGHARCGALIESSWLVHSDQLPYAPLCRPCFPAPSCCCCVPARKRGSQ